MLQTQMRPNELKGLSGILAHEVSARTAGEGFSQESRKGSSTLARDLEQSPADSKVLSMPGAL